jgi:hypothetical protein
MFNNIDFENKPINSMVILFGYAAVFFALVFALRLLFMPANVAMGVAEKTFNPDAIIYNYEWFKTQYNEIKSFDIRIKNAQDVLTSFNESYKGIQRDKWSFEATQRETELNSILLGLKNQRALMVAEYNARAKMANRNFVKFDDVPDYIEQ